MPSWVNGVALALLVLDLLLPMLDRIVRERDQYRQGRRGEEATVEALQKHLDGRWTLFCNVLWPGSRGDIDAVLVGPSGVYALEIKSYRGRCKNEGDRWWRRYATGRRRLDKDPSRQAIANATRLGEYLQQVAGVKVWVESRVVWAGPGRLYVDKPAVFLVPGQHGGL